MKRNKFGKTRKDTRWKRRDTVVVERVRKQSESEDGGNERVKRDLRLLMLENTPDGRVFNWLLWRDEEQKTVKKGNINKREKRL